MTSLFQPAESWEDQSLLEIILLTQLYYKEKHWSQLCVCNDRKTNSSDRNAGPFLVTVAIFLFHQQQNPVHSMRNLFLWTTLKIYCWNIDLDLCVFKRFSSYSLTQKHTHTWTIRRALANSGCIGFFRASNTTVIPTSFISFLKNTWLTLKLLADISVF